MPRANVPSVWVTGVIKAKGVSFVTTKLKFSIQKLNLAYVTAFILTGIINNNVKVAKSRGNGTKLQKFALVFLISCGQKRPKNVNVYSLTNLMRMETVVTVLHPNCGTLISISAFALSKSNTNMRMVVAMPVLSIKSTFTMELAINALNKSLVVTNAVFLWQPSHNALKKRLTSMEGFATNAQNQSIIFMMVNANHAMRKRNISTTKFAIFVLKARRYNKESAYAPKDNIKMVLASCVRNRASSGTNKKRNAKRKT